MSLLIPIAVTIVVNPQVTADQEKNIKTGFASIAPQFSPARDSLSSVLKGNFALSMNLEFEDRRFVKDPRPYLVVLADCEVPEMKELVDSQTEIQDAMRKFMINFLHNTCGIDIVTIGSKVQFYS